MTGFSLDKLETIICERSKMDAKNSYTAHLLAEGVLKCAEKFGEEALELALATAAKDDTDVTHEAADVFYHLLVLLQARDISLKEVMTILEARTAQSGFAEKATRTDTDKT